MARPRQPVVEYRSYELDVEQLTTGIYYYSMEYKGQRLVKKMNVVR